MLRKQIWRASKNHWFVVFWGNRCTFRCFGCALEQYGIWWPMFVLFFYSLAPVPTVIARRFSEDFSSNASNVIKETAMFFTAGIVVSAFGLPLVSCPLYNYKMGSRGLGVIRKCLHLLYDPGVFSSFSLVMMTGAFEEPIFYNVTFFQDYINFV
ncbi:Leptin receptor overlapping transcript-like 1 [Desmophyllum pertusum]|uniref:Leptin receptor overlapping transcript-like 1 n=1 Tax=Desmophyllum pertusum TaxID=174260 RepID=A0A9W9YZY1_9CNID|nr:Leptin receptor overlapping transcript-like 1 [Desmophyllum pertusum]